MAEALTILEKWSMSVHEMQIGALKVEGGTRSNAFKVGGESGLPFLFKEGRIPNRPLIAAEVYDKPDPDWPAYLTGDLGPARNNPESWAAKMVEEAGADLVCLSFQGIHPDLGDTPAKDAVSLAASVLKKIGVPLIIVGCGQAEKDNEVLPQVSEATKGERLLFGDVVQENYKTLAAACIADGHNIIAESPIDVNIAKQLNILLSDLGMPLDRIAINPTI